MSEFLPHRELSPTSPDNLDAEIDLVATIHEANQRQMQQIVEGEYESIEDKARIRLGIEPAQPMTITVARGLLRNQKDEVYGEKLWLNITEFRTEKTSCRLLPVADVIETLRSTKIYPINSFSLKEAKVVLGMIKGFEYDAETGLLERLDVMNMKVHDPRKSFTRNPQPASPEDS